MDDERLSGLKELIGEHAVKAALLRGYTITPPKAPEPVRLVTMEESREAYRQRSGMLWFDQPQWFRDKVNAADNWLVRAVNKRIIEGLPEFPPDPKWALTNHGLKHYASRADLLRIFCDEGNP